MLPVRCLDELTGASFLLVIDLVLVQALLDLLEELLGQLLLDHQRRGDRVAQENDEEDEAGHRYLPLFALVSHVQVVERVGVPKLEGVANAEEWQQEAQTFPHPVRPTWGERVVISFLETFELMV